jgi:(E)-4-hydroxy-3-methylbut-2-enyl-diphosphate synthase
MKNTVSQYQYCASYFQYQRRRSREIFIGETPLGGKNPIRIQSMTNTDTMDVDATFCQAVKMIESGCEYVRITTPTIKSVDCLREIKQKLRHNGFKTPIIADVHFNAQVALEAAKVAEKIRINPGNYTDKNKGKTDFSPVEYEKAIIHIRQNITPLIKICKEYGTVLRIGSNQGSLSERIVSRYGDTPEGMVASALEFVHICNEFDFHNIVLSMKSSNTRNMVFATRLLVHQMLEEDLDYPIHLGVTEAGNGENGRIKSAVGIGTLLTDGIGDTIRISLTENPEKELLPAKKIADRFNGLQKLPLTDDCEPFKNPFAYQRLESSAYQIIGNSMPPVVVSERDNALAEYHLQDKDFLDNVHIVDESGNLLIHNERRHLSNLLQQNKQQPVIFCRTYSGIDIEAIQLQSATDFGALLIDGLCDGICIKTPDITDDDFPIKLSFSILQAARARFSKAEFISCPSCGRTQFDIIHAVEAVREKTQHLKGLTIAVMGCIVNGPGEMSGADYGLVGSGKNRVTLFKKNISVIKNIEQEKTVEALIQLIKSNGDWKE